MSLDEIECDLDEEQDNEHFYNGKNSINSSFINKLRDISTFNPSGIKGKEREGSIAGGINSSVLIIPKSQIDVNILNRGGSIHS